MKWKQLSKLETIQFVHTNGINWDFAVVLTVQCSVFTYTHSISPFLYGIHYLYLHIKMCKDFRLCVFHTFLLYIWITFANIKLVNKHQTQISWKFRWKHFEIQFELGFVPYRQRRARGAHTYTHTHISKFSPKKQNSNVIWKSNWYCCYHQYSEVRTGWLACVREMLISVLEINRNSFTSSQRKNNWIIRAQSSIYGNFHSKFGHLLGQSFCYQTNKLHSVFSVYQLLWSIMSDTHFVVFAQI